MMKSRNLTIWVMTAVWVVSCVGLPEAEATVIFDDGSFHTIHYTIADHVVVADSYLFEPTKVALVSDGLIDEYLYAYDSSQVTMSGGYIGDQLLAYHTSQITISGGSIHWSLYAYDSSQVTMSGGSMGVLEAWDSSEVSITGGSIDYYLYARDSSQLTLSGGEIKGGGLGLIAEYEGILTIQGSDFAVDGEDFGYGELNSILGGGYYDEPIRHLTGTLESGDFLDNDFRIGYDASIVLVPEPATLLLLGLGAVMLRRKTKSRSE